MPGMNGLDLIETIRKELGSLSPVVEKGLNQSLKGGIRRDRIDAQVEEVTEWGTTNKGKRYPKTKIWRHPNPDELADKIMKAETKAERRATLKFSALGTSAAEDVPGKVRDWVEPVDEPQPVEAEFSEREPGWDDDDIGPVDPPHADEAGRV